MTSRTGKSRCAGGHTRMSQGSPFSAPARSTSEPASPTASALVAVHFPVCLRTSGRGAPVIPRDSMSSCCHGVIGANALRSHNAIPRREGYGRGHLTTVDKSDRLGRYPPSGSVLRHRAQRPYVSAEYGIASNAGLILRKQTGSWIVKAFLGVLILSFAVWGIGDIFRGPSDAAVATVGDVEITRSEFGDAYRRELDRLNQRMGQQLDADQARRLGIENLTLQRMINRALFDQVALGYGLTVSDKDLAADIRSNPAFRNDLGRFDPLYYRDVLRQLGYTREYFEYVRRADLRRTQLMNGIALGAETAPTRCRRNLSPQSRTAGRRCRRRPQLIHPQAGDAGRCRT